MVARASVHPEKDGDGVLCSRCIIRRAEALPGVICLYARIVFASDYSDDAPLPAPPALPCLPLAQHMIVCPRCGSK